MAHNLINPDSFVYSVPFDIGETRPTEVTATHAVFKEDGEDMAAAAVVGLKMDYDHFKQTFKNITLEKTQNKGLTCWGESMHCFVIDSSGFILISGDDHHTGKFLGEVDSTVLVELVNMSVLEKVKMFDYQAICEEAPDKEGSPGNSLLTPLHLVLGLVQWLVGTAITALVRLEVMEMVAPAWSQPSSLDREYAYYNYYDYNDKSDNLYKNNEDNGNNNYQNDDDVYDHTEEEEVTVVNDDQDARIEEEKYENDDADETDLHDRVLEMTYINRTKPESCDKEVFLYHINWSMVEAGVPLHGTATCKKQTDCERSVEVAQVLHSNLVLVMVDASCACSHTTVETLVPKKVPQHCTALHLTNPD